MAEQKRLKSELLLAKLRGEVSQGDYAHANHDFDAQIESLTEQLQSVRSHKATLEAFLKFSRLMLVDIAEAWRRADGDKKLRVQSFLFQGGISYTQESKFLNTINPTLFQQLTQLSDPELVVGVPDGTTLNRFRLMRSRVYHAFEVSDPGRGGGRYGVFR